MWKNWSMLQITSPKQTCVFETLGWAFLFVNADFFSLALLSISQLILFCFHPPLQYRALLPLSQISPWTPFSSQTLATVACPPALIFTLFLFFPGAVCGSVDSQHVHTWEGSPPWHFTTSTQKTFSHVNCSSKQHSAAVAQLYFICDLLWSP